jgi:thiol-disulfide isomerase/thioredoxin
MATTELTDDTFESTLSSTPLAIVDFHAGWCGPCIMFKPKFKRVSGDYSEMTFFMLDGEANPNARQSVTIDNLPYFGIYKDGVFVEGISTTKEDVFREFIERNIASAQ